MNREAVSTAAPPVERRRPAVSITVQPPQPEETPAETKSWSERLWGPEGASYTVSLIIHIALIVILAIPIIHGPSQEVSIVTTIRDSDDTSETWQIGSIIEAPQLTQQKSMTADELLAPRVDESAPYEPIPENAAIAEAAASPGDQDGMDSSDLAGAVGGYLLKEPENAVKAGRFAVFSRPVIRSVRDVAVEFGEPGDAPLAGMNYFIVIQIQVGEKRKTFPIGDLIGNVVGTDGYRQKFPQNVYYLDDEGIPQKINRSKPIKVVNGVVQLLMEVPGAKADVRDNIYLKSKMLKEEQNLQLIFQRRSRPKLDTQPKE